MKKTNNCKGFGLIGLLIVIMIIASFGGGAWYLGDQKQKQNMDQIGKQAEQRAQEAMKNLEMQNKQVQKEIDAQNQQTQKPAMEVDISQKKTYRK